MVLRGGVLSWAETGHLCLVNSGHPSPWRSSYKRGGEKHPGKNWLVLLLLIQNFMFAPVHFIVYCFFFFFCLTTVPNTQLPAAKVSSPLGPTKILQSVLLMLDRLSGKKNHQQVLNVNLLFHLLSQYNKSQSNNQERKKCKWYTAYSWFTSHLIFDVLNKMNISDVNLR